VAITATGISSTATAGKVVAAAKSADVSLRAAKSADASLRTAKPASVHATAHAAAAHPTTATTVTATATVTAAPATASHCWWSKGERERERRRSNQFEISHRVLLFPERPNSLLLLEEEQQQPGPLRSEGCVTLDCGEPTAADAMHLLSRSAVRGLDRVDQLCIIQLTKW
jgi:hypothetical protein